MNSPQSKLSRNTINAVIVAALGYFVDIYDLLLFSIVRIPSLKDLGLEGDQLQEGLVLLEMQMLGMLIGGIFWGVLGDKKGRLSVLFGSILTYSIANIANGMVDTVFWYAVWRFIAGLGLAGELGAGITLVAELLPKEKRGYGTTIVASIGILGAVAAGFIAKIFDWRTCYYIGGGLGLMLLLLRVGVSESGMFEGIKKKANQAGNFLALFKKRATVVKYLRCIFIALPTWYVIGILIAFSPEFAQVLGVVGIPEPRIAIMYTYTGIALGDVASGLLSQYLKSRIKVMYLFLSLNVLTIGAYFGITGLELDSFYWLCGIIGFSVGYWAIFVTVAAEQFGTNIRATVATTAPNFVRGALVPIAALFQVLTIEYGLYASGIAIAILCMSIAFFALFGLEETFGKDLDYVEKL
jgi:MFS transporter, putative metabolite:H+ symporter